MFISYVDSGLGLSPYLAAYRHSLPSYGTQWVAQERLVGKQYFASATSQSCSQDGELVTSRTCLRGVYVGVWASRRRRNVWEGRSPLPQVNSLSTAVPRVLSTYTLTDRRAVQPARSSDSRRLRILTRSPLTSMPPSSSTTTLPTVGVLRPCREPLLAL